MTPKTEFVKFLGRGSVGSVNLVKYIKSDISLPLYAAVKTAECEEYDSLKREIQVLSKLKGCRNIVQCYDGNYTLEEDFDVGGFRVYKMVMEYASAGSLTTFMYNYKDYKLPDTLIRDFTRMILQGLVSVHSHGYVHCDLKPDNLLIFPCRDQSYELKISDFGSSRRVGEDSDCWEVDNPYMGTPIYMSPESVRDNVAEKALDLWSLGCIVLEMYTGVFPWSEVYYEDLAPVLLNGEAPVIPESLPCDARKFLETCFARNPKERGSASDLLLHQFLRGEHKMEDTISGGSSLPVSKKAMKLKIIPPKPPQFKHLKVKIRPPKPPAFSFIHVQ
ncbi:PREDICTED: mitogen-activated protein kinase kinase kinase ANP1-like [Camelina sativa]|uniref:Mitogen-activated protein kinase kinase kinase ANP1-like n=1 Tax=Camelina sativa TaxID=90675 RepID=A0ABM0Z4K9_CAMSA|nr:PREDICTED: mitogen-activated protein kinase kinase kinase ANP1-like [Camelina sativa]